MFNSLKPALNNVYYIYCNKSNELLLEAYLHEHFNNFINLNISSSAGCCFKLITDDINSIKQLDLYLETLEGWIQTERKNDFNDLENNTLNLDRYLIGCNYRLSGIIDSSAIDILKIKYKINAHNDLIAVRNLNFITAAVAGSYTQTFGTDIISAAIPANSVQTNNLLYIKDLNGSNYNLEVTDCDLSGYVIEYRGNEDIGITQSLTYGLNTYPAMNLTNALDTDFISHADIALDNLKILYLGIDNPQKITKFNVAMDVKSGVAGNYNLWVSGYYQGHTKTNMCGGAAFPKVTDDNLNSNTIHNFSTNYTGSLDCIGLMFGGAAGDTIKFYDMFLSY